MAITATLRRWCDTCLKVTVSWIDSQSYERCSGCDPQDPRRPGHGMPATYPGEW